MRLRWLRGRFAVCRLPADAEPPPWVRGNLVSITRTPNELSVVCEDHADIPQQVSCQRGFLALEVEGPLDFSEVGVLQSLTRPLAAAGVSLFALSTYDTDYLLIPASKRDEASRALHGAGHAISDDVTRPPAPA